MKQPLQQLRLIQQVSAIKYEYNIIASSPKHLCSLAPSGPPQSLRVLSATLSNITVQWDKVSCLERNGPIGNYAIIVTGPYWASPEEPLHYTTNRVYTVLDLQPRNTYTVTVRAVSSDNFSDIGPSASLIANTTTPLGKVYVASLIARITII